MIKPLLFLFLLLIPLSLNAQSVSRYRVDTSDESIAQLQFNLTQGLLQKTDAEKFRGRLDKITLEDIKKIFDRGPLIQNGYLKIDGHDTKISPKSVLFMLHRIHRYVHDTKLDGSIEYSYKFNYKNWIVTRYMLIENDNIITRVNVNGIITSQVDRPSVYTTVNYASLLLEVNELEGSDIKTTMTLGYNQSYNAKCKLVRRISARIAPGETKKAISSEIDSQLYNLSEKVREVIKDGRDQETIIDRWLELVANTNTGR